MSKGAKQNWFESPLNKNGFWFFHQDKNDLFNFYKSNANQKTLFLTPSRNSKPIEIQKNRSTPYYFSSEQSQTQNCKFDDVHLPDMFSNTKIQKQVINERLNFEDSSVIKQQQDFLTPQRQVAEFDSSCIKEKGFLHDTTAKKSNFHFFQQKKTRPKEKGLRMLSQKAFQIVLKMNGATYKQVANVLVDQLATQDNIQIDGKDQQNIKRRVYDALNVLIALGVLRKDGRKIHGVQKSGQSYQQQCLKLKQLQNRLASKQKILQLTKSTLKKIQEKYTAVKSLIRRNHLKFQKHNKIQFPILAAFVSQQDQDKISISRYRVEMKILNQSQPFGDLDAILFLKPLLKDYIQ